MTEQATPDEGQNQETQASPKEGDKVADELAEFKDKYYRALAEIENTRKRLQREKAESQSYAIQGVILDLLHPIDHFEQALKHIDGASTEVKQWAQGFSMILSQLRGVLGDNGVMAFDSKGQAFDPHLHEAIETIETNEAADGTIIEEFVRGYKLGSRVIRPAKVKVARTVQEDVER